MVLRRPLVRQFHRTGALISAAVLASGCASGLNSGFGFGSARQPLPVTGDRVYRLGVGDKLKLSVFGEDNLSGPLEVNATGAVNAPLIGEIAAKGMTLAEFKDEIERRLAAGYLQHPKIAVDVSNYRPIYVHGEVKSGGEIPFKNGLRLRDAVAIAGGYTYRADKSTITLGRDSQLETEVAATGDMAILPGDNIRIPERLF